MRVLGAISPGVSSAAVNAPEPAPAPVDPTAAEAAEAPGPATPRDDEDDRPTARIHRTVPDAPDPRTRYRRATRVGTSLQALWA